MKCFHSFCSSGKDALALLHHFQDCYCCSHVYIVSCDKILQCDCITLYSAAGHGLYTQFAEAGLKLQSFSTRILAFVTRPFLCWFSLGTRL